MRTHGVWFIATESLNLYASGPLRQNSEISHQVKNLSFRLISQLVCEMFHEEAGKGQGRPLSVETSKGPKWWLDNGSSVLGISLQPMLSSIFYVDRSMLASYRGEGTNIPYDLDPLRVYSWVEQLCEAVLSVSFFFFEEHIPGGLCAATELCDVLKMLCGRSWHVRAGKTTRLRPVRAVKFLLRHTGESMIVRRLRRVS